MRRFLFGLLGLGLVMATGCTEDPTDSLRTGAQRVVTTRTYLQLTPGDSAPVTAQTLDGQGNPLTSPLPEVVSGTPSVATVSVDTLKSGRPLPETNFFVKGINPGEATIRVSAEGVADTNSSEILTLVFPETFPGTVAVNSAGLHDTIVVTGDAVVGFETTGTSSAVVDGAPMDIVSLTDLEMKIAWSAAEAVSGAEIILTDVLFLGQFPLDSLAAGAQDLTQDDDEPSNDSPFTPTVLPFNEVHRGTVSSSDIDDWWIVTVPATGNMDFFFEFVGDGEHPDADIIIFDAGLNLVGFGASLNNPEIFTAVVPAGDYILELNMWDTGAGADDETAAPDPMWYRVIVRPAVQAAPPEQ
jgi:hypothetical protein